MPLPSMYQYHQHTITIYVSQPCTEECTKPSTFTIPNIKHLPQPVPHQVHQPCTNTCTKPCINHAPQLYQTMHQPCTITCTISLNHQPCTSTPYHVSILYHTMYQPCTLIMYINTCTIPCTNNVSQPYTISLNHAIHHAP
jgi:hypothetical protein